MKKMRDISFFIFTLLLFSACGGNGYPKGKFPPLDGSGGGMVVFYSEQLGDRDSEIFIMNADGSDPIQLTDNDAHDMSPNWSPDGKYIVFTSTRNDPNPIYCFPSCNFDIYIMNGDGSDQWQLTDTDKPEMHTVWSPDGSKIAFASTHNNNNEIYVMDADGNNVFQLTDNDSDDMHPTWSPDGSQLVFNSNRTGNWDIFVMDIDGSNQQALINTPDNEYFPDWSPDGEKVLFASGPGSSIRGEVFVMDIDGSNVIQLTDNGLQINEDPRWSSNGEHIIFQSTRDGNFEIYVMDADGSDQHNLTQNPASDYWPDFINIWK
jgi:Tol biopolymer transport system component